MITRDGFLPAAPTNWSGSGRIPERHGGRVAAGRGASCRDLVANIAHELRTPLATPQGYLEALRDGVTPATPATLASLHEEVMRLVRLVNALHQLSQFDARMSRLRRTEVDVTTLAREVLTAYAPEFERRGFVIHDTHQPAGQHAYADADLLGQALRTLVDNVLQYAPDGATVTVRTERSGGAVRIAVENTGEDMAAEDLPHIFERFYRGEKSRSRATGCAGIGLSLVQEIACAHGGETGATSADGLTVCGLPSPRASRVARPNHRAKVFHFPDRHLDQGGAVARDAAASAAPAPQSVDARPVHAECLRESHEIRVEQIGRIVRPQTPRAECAGRCRTRRR